MRVIRKDMMLIPILILFHVTALCQGKSLDYRGKRSYGHGQNPELHGNFYYPRIDGQPIYVPSIGSAADVSEFLDDYYRKIKESSQAWPSATQFPVNYEENYFESPATSNSMVKTVLGDTDEDGHRGGFHRFPTESQLEYHKFNPSYYTEPHEMEYELDDRREPPYLYGKVNKNKSGYKTSIPKKDSELKYGGYEEPVVQSKTSIKKSGDKTTTTKTESEYADNHYEQPVVGDKIDLKKSGNKAHIKKESELEYVGYEEPVQVNRINVKSGKKPSITKAELEYVDYEQPVVDKSKVKKTGHKHSITKSESELEYTDYEKPVVVDKNKKKSGHKPSITKAESELEYVDYEEPVVVDRVNIKKSGDKHSITKSESELEYTDYEKPVVVHKNKKKPGHKPSVTKTESEMEYVDYEKPVVVDRVNVKKSGGKESELEYIDYEEPLVVDRINVKKSGNKPNIPKLEGNYADGEYEPPVVHKTVKDEKVKMVSLDKKPGKVSPTVNYGDLKTRAPNKKSNKAKRRKQSQPPKKYETSSEYPITVVKRENLEEYPENEFMDDLYAENHDLEKTENKNEAPVKYKQKVVIKSEGKETPVKHKEKVLIKSESKETPVKHKEKVVNKSESKETPVKNKDKVVIKSEAKKPPVKTGDKVAASELYDNVYENSDGKSEEVLEGNAEDSKFPGEELKSNKNPNIYEDAEDTTENVVPEDQTDKIFEFDHTSNPNEHFNFENKGSSEFESSGNGPLKGGDNSINVPRFFPNLDAIESLSSLNSNIWSLVFNPNAERQRSKRCVTRNNETGYCTYVQHCEVPDIATSLEQLLRNACVIDDIFIGVCCPEFPVQTVKVHWEQDISNSGKQTEAEFGDSTDDCGIRSNEASKVNSWPWKAPLISMSNGKIFCGGVLISEDYVLTAAHCTTKIPRNQILVRLGQYDDSTGEDFAVVEIKRHAQYNPRTMHNDVALLKLGRRIVQDHFIGVICLPDDDDDTDEHDGKKAILLGWKVMFGTQSNKTEFLQVMEHKECGNKLPAAIPKTVLCTETRNEDERTCNADSGAPLVIEDDGKFEVIGILSWNRNDCDQRFPSTFSRVSSFAGWIRKHAV